MSRACFGCVCFEIVQNRIEILFCELGIGTEVKLPFHVVNWIYEALVAGKWHQHPEFMQQMGQFGWDILTTGDS